MTEGHGIMDIDECEDATQTLIMGLLNMDMLGRNWREYPEEIKHKLEEKGSEERILRHVEVTGMGQDYKVLAFTKIYMYVGATVPEQLKDYAFKSAQNDNLWSGADAPKERHVAMLEFVRDLTMYAGESVPLEYIPMDDRVSYVSKGKK